MKETNWLKLSVTVAAVVGILSMSPAPAFAQWENVRSPNISRTANGKPNLSAPATAATSGT